MKKFVLTLMLVFPLFTQAAEQVLTIDDFKDDLQYISVTIEGVTPAQAIPVEQAFEFAPAIVYETALQNIDLGTDVIKWQREATINGRKEVISGTAVIELKTNLTVRVVERWETAYQEVSPGIVQAASFPVFATRTEMQKRRGVGVEFDRRSGRYFIPEQHFTQRKKVPVIVKSKEEKFNDWRVSVGLEPILEPIDLPIK